MKNEGGGNYVIDQLASYFVSKGHKVVFDFDNSAEVVLINSWQVDLKKLKKFKKKNPKTRIVHRLDGLARIYGRMDGVDEIAQYANTYADISIYQSEFIKTEFLKEGFDLKAGPVIHNPVDTNKFAPPKVSLARDNLLIGYITWSKNKLKGFEDLNETISNNPNVNFKLIGNYPIMSDNKNIEFTGTLSRDEIPLEIQKIDALLTYSENEACPNHVLEAMSCAKPILYKNSGAMKEIIEDCGFEVSPSTFNEIITQRKMEFNTIGKRSRNRIIDKFESSDILKKYLRIIENELS